MSVESHVGGFKFPLLLSDVRSIRLLDLAGVGFGKNTNLHCRLRSFALTTCPPYRALSCTWERPFPEDDDPSDVEDWNTPTTAVSCNGTPFHLRRNLYDALQEVVRKELTGWYWIDSICINQSDMAEREAQAMIMGDIFASAEEVVC